jgi:hypothetical protein
MTPSAHRRRSNPFLLWCFRRSKHRVVHDIKVAVFDREPTAILDKVESALDLVLRNDRRAMQVLRAETDGIFVAATHGVRAEWRRNEKLVMLRPEYVSASGTSTLQLASTLVHEATHAWLEKLGFQYSPERRPRIETICFRRELRFVRHASGPKELIGNLERQLTLDPEYLSDESFRERLLIEIERLGLAGRLVIAAERWVNRCRRLARRLKPS